MCVCVCVCVLLRPGLLAYDDPELDDIPGLPAPKELFSRKRVLPRERINKCIHEIMTIKCVF